MTGVFVRLSLALALAVGITTYLSVGRLHADDATSQPAASQPAAGDNDPEALKHNMDHMNKALRKLRAQLQDPSQNDASAALAADLQKTALACVNQVPPMAASVPADKRDKFISDYKEMMGGLADQFNDLQKEFTDGKNDKAAKTVDSIIDTMKEGHKDFRKPEQP